MPLQATSGAASYDAFGGGVAAVPQYIEDVFSTYLYTGNGTSLTVTNNIDLSTKGGLVWLKSRSTAGTHHTLFDSARGANNFLFTDLTDAQTTDSGQTLNTTGFTIGNNSDINTSAATYASWTFRKQPKFFDVVTYTGNGTARTISHSLGSVPACIIVKQTSAAGEDWAVYHRGLPLVAGSLNDNFLTLNTTSAYSTSTDIWNRTVPTSTVFSVGNHPSTNSNGASYVAYLFAHNAGGFGLTGTDNVISCGSYTSDGAGNATINLGYEPQWVMVKAAGTSSQWFIWDTMRGLNMTNDSPLYADASSAESTSIADRIDPTATGFNMKGFVAYNTQFIYIAIRRGPMKVPTSGTSVFQPLTRNGTGGATTVTSTVRPDTVLQNWRSGGLGSANHFMYDRLRGVAKALFTDTADAESTQTATGINAFNNLSYGIAGAGSMNNGSALYADYVFTRAPSFFDEVCYTGTGSATTVTHNLQAVPELIITKCRGDAFGWAVYSSAVGNTAALFLETTAVPDTNSAYWNNTTPTSTVFSVGSANRTNRTSLGMVAYLFATCAGVSKVGSYTGSDSDLNIDCGFTSGARFVMIKRTDASSDWYVWDSARGIVSGNDPRLSLNTTAAEVTDMNMINTYSAGFSIPAGGPNTGAGATFIYLAIA